MPKEIKFGGEIQTKLKHGVDTIADAVKVTLGPSGRNVVIEKSFGSPEVTKDGVTVARAVELADQFENVGAQLVKEVASKTNDVAGDGTTTATVLAQAIFNEGQKHIADGGNPVYLKKGIDKAVEIVVEELKTNLSTPIKSDEDLEKIASISANSPAIGKVIADTMRELGPSGAITIEEGTSFDTENEVVKGMRFDKGLISPYLATDPERGVAELSDVAVLVVDGELRNIQELLPIIEKIIQSGKKSALIVANDIAGDALSTLVVNKLKGIFLGIPVKAPGFGNGKKDMLKDIAIITGASVVSVETGVNLEDMSMEHIGNAEKVVVTKEHTTIVKGAGAKEAVDERIVALKTELEGLKPGLDSEKLKERLGKLGSGVGVIKVGAATETEISEIKQRVEDALNSTRAAVEEGIVPGGGVALVRASQALEGHLEGLEGDVLVGAKIVRNALSAPLKQIAKNAGIDSKTALGKVQEAEGNFGLNASTEEYEDLVKAGVIDPAKVTRSAVQNASSIASLLLMTEVAIVDIPDENAPAGMPPMMPGM